MVMLIGILKEGVDCFQNDDEFIEAPESLDNVGLHNLKKFWEIEASVAQV